MKAVVSVEELMRDMLDPCEGCHRSYWYPGETPEFYGRLDRRLRDLQRPRAGPSGR